jgi:hypothetical protein
MADPHCKPQYYEEVKQEEGVGDAGDDDDDVTRTNTNPFIVSNSHPTERHVRFRSSVQSLQCVYKSQGRDAAIGRAFQELDLLGTGQLDRHDLTALLEEACASVKLPVGHQIVEDAVEALLEDAGAEGQSLITLSQFQELFRRHPDLSTCFENSASVASRQSTVIRGISPEDQELEDVENLQVWMHDARTRWRSNKIEYLWSLVYLAANIVCSYTRQPTTANMKKPWQFLELASWWPGEALCA